MDWFRYYSDTARDPKLLSIAAEIDLPFTQVVGVWSLILCLANDSSTRGTLFIADKKAFTIKQMARMLQLDVTVTETLLRAFETMRCLHEENGVWVVTHWGARQYVDSSTARVREYRERRKAAGLSKGVTYDVASIIGRDGGQCIYCGDTESLCVDHIVPIIGGGTDDLDNLACACKKCNSGKAGRTPEQAGYAIQSVEASSRYARYVTVTPVTETTDVTVPRSVSVSVSPSVSPSVPEGGLGETAKTDISPLCKLYHDLTLNCPTAKDKRDEANLSERPDFDVDIARAVIKLNLKDKRDAEGNVGWVPRTFSYFEPAIITALESGRMPGTTKETKPKKITGVWG